MLVSPDEIEFTNFSDEVIPGQYIVIFESSGLKSAYKDKITADNVVLSRAEEIFNLQQIEMNEPELVYSAAFEGMAIKMSEAEAEKLAGAKGVAGVWPDIIVALGRWNTDPVDPPAQVVQYGVERTGYANYTGSSKAWIIDTGIDLDHPDLNVDQINGANFDTRVSSPDDDHGHGTHCAGVVGAIDNTIGVVGVAAGATVVPVKVLDKRGRGASSVIIAGIDYVAANAAPGDVANLSLGGGIYELTDLAVIALGAKGIYVALAAGNESEDAENHSPARAEGANLYTVSAMDINDNWASFSNFGDHVDYCAPGVNVFSTYKGGAFATMSGTSMAAPHVCGLLLLTNDNLTTDGYVNGDPDGNPDPIAHN